MSCLNWAPRVDLGREMDLSHTLQLHVTFDLSQKFDFMSPENPGCTQRISGSGSAALRLCAGLQTRPAHSLRGYQPTSYRVGLCPTTVGQEMLEPFAAPLAPARSCCCVNPGRRHDISPTDIDMHALVWQGATAWKAIGEEPHLSYESASCQWACRGAAARSKPGLRRSATAHRLLYQRAPSQPVPCRPMCHIHCAGCLSPGQAAQPCVSEFMTFVSFESTAAVSNHV